MPYDPASSDIRPSEQLPQHLAHRPVYAVPYEQFDGHYVGDTDARYISIGNAQWNEDEVSVKIMRYVGDKWTRQAEELPLHRAIDATVFLIMAVFCTNNGVIRLPPGTFHNQNTDITITMEDRRFGELAAYMAYLDSNLDLLKERLNALVKVLDLARNSGKI